jgi:hypothetical protein
MPAAVPVSQRSPRRARYLIPLSTPRRREILAALALLAGLGSLLFAPVTLGLAVAFYATGKITRWRPVWLAVPAACGVVWVLAIGPAAALAGFVAAPRAVVSLLGGLVTDPARLTHLDAASTGSVSWFPGQLPIALILAAVIAAVAWWLDWLHTDEWRLPAPRPGLVSLCRRRFTTAFVKSGGVLTRTGACLGVDQDTGQPAAVSWREAGRGVLITGAVRRAASASGFQLVHAAIRLRKPVIVVDLAAGDGLTASLAAVCAATGAPLQVFGTAGTAYYEPLGGGDPAHKAALVMGMIDWAQAPDSVRLGCQACLTDVFAVAEAAPVDPARAVLDDVVELLRPGSLGGRMERVPPYHPRRTALAGRVAITASRLEAEASMATFVAEQLTGLRASPLGLWLGASPAVAPGPEISLSEVVRQRGVALFSLDRAAYGRPADLIANLVAQDITEVYAGLRHTAIEGDGLAWFGQCETVDPQALADLVGVGADTGLATVLSTTSAGAVARLADQVSVLVLHRLADRALAGQLAWLTGRRLVPADLPSTQPAEDVTGWPEPGGVPVDGVGGAHAGTARPGPTGPAGPVGWAAPLGAAWSPVVTGDALCALGEGEFTLVPRATDASRVVPLAVSVPARVPARQAAPAPGAVGEEGLGTGAAGPMPGPVPAGPARRRIPGRSARGPVSGGPADGSVSGGPADGSVSGGPARGPVPPGPVEGPVSGGPAEGPVSSGPAGGPVSSGPARRPVAPGSPPGQVPPGWGDGGFPPGRSR